MIEIVFDESARGNLRYALFFGRGPWRGSTGTVLYVSEDGTGNLPSEEQMRADQQAAEERERRAWERAVPMEGSIQDIFCFPLCLSVGDISEERPGPLREQALKSISTGARFGANEEWEKEEIRRRVREAGEALDTVCSRILAGEAARIWYSDQPDERCGLSWFLDQLARRPGTCGPLYAVKLPEWEERADGSVVSAWAWGEMPSEEWSRHIHRQELLSPAVCRCHQFQWKELKEENSPLRAVVSRRLMSVPADFYDGFLRRELAAQEGPVREWSLIVGVLSRGLGLGDGWLAGRIEGMIQRGEVSVVRPDEPDRPYSRLLQRNL